MLSDSRSIGGKPAAERRMVRAFEWRKLMQTAKHSWLHAMVASAFLFGSVAKGAAAEDTIKIGILHSLSGTMAISETILKDLMLMQVAELNEHGGLLGKKVEPIVVDPASNWPLFAEKARELLSKDKWRPCSAAGPRCRANPYCRCSRS
jgi:hypothetical protein